MSGRRSWSDRVELAMDLGGLTFIEAAIRFGRLPRVARMLGIAWDPVAAANPEPPGELSLDPSASRQLRLALAASRRWPFGDTCLRRSLLMGWRLRRLHPVLCIGIARNPAELMAHAWIEIDGHPLDSETARFARMQAIRPDGA